VNQASALLCGGFEPLAAFTRLCCATHNGVLFAPQKPDRVHLANQSLENFGLGRVLAPSAAHGLTLGKPQ